MNRYRTLGKDFSDCTRSEQLNAALKDKEVKRLIRRLVRTVLKPATNRVEAYFAVAMLCLEVELEAAFTIAWNSQAKTAKRTSRKTPA